jgi:hypothetical protein
MIAVASATTSGHYIVPVLSVGWKHISGPVAACLSTVITMTVVIKRTSRSKVMLGYWAIEESRVRKVL